MSVGHLPFQPLKIIICPMLLYSTNWEFPESFSRKCLYPENLWFWQHIPTPFIPLPFYLSPLVSPHNTYKEAGLSIQTHYIFCFLSSLEYFCPALIFLISMMPSFHFHFSSERKHCKIHHRGVCGVLLLPLTELVDSTNKIKVMKIQSVLKIQGWTENNLSALLQLDPVFQFRPCQNNRLF